MKFGFGQHVQRVEDFRLLRGEGTYVDDVTLSGQAHASFLRSPVAHGRLISVDASAARGLPGVLGIWTAADLGDRLRPMGNEMPLGFDHVEVFVHHLATDTVRFVGQPIALIVAETRAAADDAAEAIAYEIDELPSVTDPEAALEPGAPQLHAAAPGNLAYAWECGDRAAVERLFATAAHRVETPVLNQRIVVASIEPRAINITYHADIGRWEAWCSSQGVFGMRAKIAAALGVEAERIRIHTGDVGGAFGMKLMNHPEYALCAVAAEALQRPVKWVASRSEAFLSDAQGRDMRGRVEGAFDSDGRLRAVRMRTVSGLGAHLSTAAAAVHTIFSATLLGGMYGIEAMHAEVRGAFLNTPPTDAYRGAGRPETIYATERLMEAAARQLGIDRIELRRRNLLRAEQAPHASPGGFTFDSLDCRKVLDRALEAADVTGFEARAAAAAGNGRARGLGVAYYFERTGGGPVENTAMTMDADGTLSVSIGTQSSGQGHETAWAQIVHEALGVPFERIVIRPGDSDSLPAGGGTGGSRSAIKAGQVLADGAQNLVDKGMDDAARLLEAARGDVEYYAAHAAYRIKGTDRQITLERVAAEIGGLAATGHVNEKTTTFPNGAHICEVEVDLDTGRPSIERYTVIDDFGRMINPMLVAGQVHGGAVQGIGQVIGEGAIWDGETGQPLNGSFMDYAMPRAGDVPMFSLAFEEVPSTSNPLGIKGCGEAGSVGGIPSTALAILDALWRAGVRDTVPETPYTPLKLWQALQHRDAAALAAE
ncbi:MAG: xanthine dehydrogenase family protein molybdopterin-binding subunit [Pseudomonadota bacterium]